MANGYLKATAVGNLGQDPELRHTQGGTSVLNMRIACNQRVKRGGEWVDEATWVGVVAFGKRAEGLNKILTKGKQIMAVGRLEVRVYEKRDGTKGTDVSIVADDIVPLGGREGGQRQGYPSGGGGAPPADDYGGYADSFSDDDSIPF